MAFDVSLRTDGDARVKKVELLGCEGDLEEPGRQVIWGNTFAEAQSSPAKFKLLLEFPPFDVEKKLGVTNASTFTKGYIDHLCRVRIFSQVGTEAIKNGEIQESAPFTTRLRKFVYAHFKRTLFYRIVDYFLL